MRPACWHRLRVANPVGDVEVALPSRWRIALAALAVPVGLMLFYAVAHPWLNHGIVEQNVAKLNDSDAAALRATDLGAICTSSAAEVATFRTGLTDAGICRDFWLIDTAFRVSTTLVIATLVWLTTISLLVVRARPLGERLVRAYRIAWRLTPGAAIVKVTVETVLLTFASFEVTVLATNTYFPKLILFVMVGGGIALANALNAMRLRIPLESNEAFVTHLTRTEAPQLWQLVDQAAGRAGTTPPDNILIAENTSFYVTEFKVNHANGSVAGKTMVLSRPLMTEMTPRELLAVVGHELAHFSGGDTFLTRELYPRHVRSNVMTEGLAASLLGFSPLQLLRFLGASFQPLLQAQSRIRELAADAVGAWIASPRDQAHALVRIHVLDEAFGARWQAANQTPMDAEGRAALVQAAIRRPLRDVAAETLFQIPAFWPHLFSRTTAHPLDSHPPLSARLEALGVAMDPSAAAALVNAPMTPEETAVSLLGSATEKLAKTSAALDERIAEVADHDVTVQRIKSADADTPEGKTLLERHFPPREWPVGQGSLIAACGFLGLLSTGAAVAMGACVWNDETVLVWVFMPIFLLFGIWTTTLWVRHRHAVLRLSCDRIAYTTWSEPLPLKEVERFSWRVNNNQVTLTMHLKAKALRRDRWVFKNTAQNQQNVPLSFQSNQIEIANAILRYVQRNID